MGKKRGGGQNRLGKVGEVSPLFVLRLPSPLLRALRREARMRNLAPSALAREILGKALKLKGRRS
jgi:hypothetical protein